MPNVPKYNTPRTMKHNFAVIISLDLEVGY